MTQQPPTHGGQPWRPPPPPHGQPPNGPPPTRANWGQPPHQGRPPGWSLSNPDPPASASSAPGHPSAAGQFPGAQAPQGSSSYPGGQYPGRPNQGPFHQTQQPGGQAPLGQREHASISIDQFQQPPSRKRWIVPGIIALVVLALVGAMWWNSGTPTEPLPTNTPSSSEARPTERPTNVPTGNLVPFHSPLDNADGEWEIVKSTWTDRGLELDIRIKVTKGNLGYSFFALDNASVNDSDPVEITDADALPTRGTINEGDEVKGKIVFDKERGDTTVYLATRYGRQLSALGVKG